MSHPLPAPHRATPLSGAGGRLRRAGLGLSVLVGLLAASGVGSAWGYVEVRILPVKQEFLLYAPVEVQVEVANFQSAALDLGETPGQQPSLDFFVVTTDHVKINRISESWKMPTTTIPPNASKTLTVDLLPLFELRELGEYMAMAEVVQDGKSIGASPGIRFQIAKGSTIWEQRYTAPPSPEDAMGQSRPRTYSLVLHRLESERHLYVRVINPEKKRVLCTTTLGTVVNFGEPETRIDLKGALHVFHQSGTRLFTYSRISADGKWLGSRYFSNMGSAPKMVAGGKDQVEIMGGEEVFPTSDSKWSTIPSEPIRFP